MDITLSLGVLLGWETSSEGETISFYFSDADYREGLLCNSVMMLMLVMVMVMIQRTRGEKKGDV